MNHDEQQTSASAHDLERQMPSAALASCTRRQFAKWSLAALPGVGLFSAFKRARAAETPHGKPNSKFAGVQVGLNVPYSFANGSMSGDDILKYCVQLGLSAVELRTQPVEAFLGVPADLLENKKTPDPPSRAGRAEQLAKWRKSGSMDRVKGFRR